MKRCKQVFKTFNAIHLKENYKSFVNYVSSFLEFIMKYYQYFSILIDLNPNHFINLAL